MHGQQVTWNLECFESIHTLATALAGSLAEDLTAVKWLSSNAVRKGVAVLNKCANPVCCAQFRYLHQGKLFEVEARYAETSRDGQSKPDNGKGHVELCWLCDACVAHVTLRFDARRGMIMVSSLEGPEEALLTAISQSNGPTAARIARVLIRPLDLELELTASSRRKVARELSVRKEEAA